MSIPGLFIALLLSLIALAIVARPLLGPARRRRSAGSSLRLESERVQTYYERVLTNIRDLDEDFATGKINEDDYQAEREVWAQRGIRLLRVQDQMAREGSSAAAGADAERIDRAIEEAVAAYRAALHPERDKGERLLEQGSTSSCALATIAVMLAGCGGLGGEPAIIATLPPRVTSESAQPASGDWKPNLANGGRIFAERCVECHGNSGDGRGELVLATAALSSRWI